MSAFLTEQELLQLVQEQLGQEPIPEPVEIEYGPEDFTGLRLRNDNVVVRLLEPPDTNESGIHLARPKKVPCSRCYKKGDGKCELCHGSMMMRNPNLDFLVEAEVLAVGRGYFTDEGGFVPMELKVGDIVLVPHNAGDKYNYTQDVRIVRSGSEWSEGSFKPGEVWAVFEGEDQ